MLLKFVKRIKVFIFVSKNTNYTRKDEGSIGWDRIERAL